MKVDVLDMKGEKISTVELPPAIFEAPINIDLMHQAYVRQMSNARLGTHNTRRRGEVSGGGRKPWRQKGTGRARQGSIRAAQWVGGGKIHTPKPRDYSKAMPRKMRRAALRSALSVKAAQNDIVILQELDLPEAKTKLMAQALDSFIGNASVLLLFPEKDDNYEKIVRSARNLPGTKTLLADYVNIRDLFVYEKLIMTIKSLDVLASFLG